MDSQCIPANPDISGIGVRAAIYTQNLFCFAPVVAHLWDGTVSSAELEGVKDQSIGMLAVAFAILISTIVEATSTNIVGGQGLTRFHAAIILDLSWMNNTSTWIWFLLYVHQRTKPGEETDFERKLKRDPIPATWAAWTGVLLSPVRHLVTGGCEIQNGVVDGAGGEITPRTRKSFAQHAWVFATKRPVLTIGSLHLSLMAGIGLWLWSNPSKFGAPMGNCNPSFSVVGGAVRFSSSGLRIFSLGIYCLLVIPGLNLVLPFLFFLALHITYNKSRLRLEPFLHVIRAILSSISTLVRRCHTKTHDPESGMELQETPSPTWAQTPSTARLDHTAFLIAGLICLLIINIILLVDVELMLRRNKHNQSAGENDWGFGQVLALLLLVVPLRDFVTSILKIREIVAKNKETIQRSYNKHLADAIEDSTFHKHDFVGLIEQGADPNVKLDGAGQIRTLLHFAASKGNDSLVRLLLDKGVEDTEGWAFHAAARNKHHSTVRILGDNTSEGNCRAHLGPVLRGLERSLQDINSVAPEVALAWLSPVRAKGLEAKFWEEFRSMIPMVVESLLRPDRETLHTAIKCLPRLGVHKELQPDIRPAIPRVMELLKHNDLDIRQGSVECLSSLATHKELQPNIQPVIPIIVELLKDGDSDVRCASVECLSNLGTHKELQPDIQPAISIVAELLKDDNWKVRQASVDCLSSLGTHKELQPDIQPAIPMVVELLKDHNWSAWSASIQCLSCLGAYKEFHPEIRLAIPMLVELLKDEDSDVRRASVGCLSSLGTHKELQLDIQPVIPIVTELLKDDNWKVRQASVECLSSLATHRELQPDIRPAIPMVVELLKGDNANVRQASIQCLSSLGTHKELKADIRPAIPMAKELLKDSDSDVCQAAVRFLSVLESK
ncbi:Multiple ankyrin repeats single kh domain [Mycena sanguinolenta]|uniref:Vacuolar protein 8 n=1 Tax=Mycena sanguinolenta TaxID=230812 RepID=A0A8H6XB81_9AGAR|nr:Multiple ankyrin repeats single kh domain [Mycena sanguinolenta]